MFENVKIEVRPENQKKVVDKIAEVIKADELFRKPIIGTSENWPNTVFIIYEGVENGQEVAIAAMCNGAVFATFI